MQETIESLQTMNGITTLKGVSGIGKTILAKRLAHFVSDRSIFKNGVMYFCGKNYDKIETLYTDMFNFIER